VVKVLPTEAPISGLAGRDLLSLTTVRTFACRNTQAATHDMGHATGGALAQRQGGGRAARACTGAMSAYAVRLRSVVPGTLPGSPCGPRAPLGLRLPQLLRTAGVQPA